MSPHVLIIDDNMMNIDVLVLLLQNEGVTATTMTSPRTLVATLDSLNQIDVVFLDLEMPNYSGFDILTTLHNHPLTQDIPIVAYTVHTNEIERAQVAGFHSFLGKPLRPQQFSGQFQRILNNEPVWEV